MRRMLRYLFLSVAVLVGISVLKAYPLQGYSNSTRTMGLESEAASAAEVYAYITYEDGTKEPLPTTYEPNQSLREMIAKEGTQGSESHPVPDVPVIADGVFYANPAILNELFIGKKLRYIVDTKAEKEGVVYVFSTVDGYLDYIQEHWGIASDKSSILFQALETQ